MGVDLVDKELTTIIHGLKRPGDDGKLIPADLFKSKFASILSALREADKAVNEKKRFDYLVFHLAVGSAAFGLREHPIKAANPVNNSSISAFMECADAIYRSNFEVARRYNGLANKLLAICAGVETKFARMEIGPVGGAVISVDNFFQSQVERFTREMAEPATKASYFTGQSYEAIDCEFKEVDFRGQLWRGILVLSGSSREVDCILDSSAGVDAVRRHLNTRVWAEGNAIYDGTSQLPARLEVKKMRTIAQSGDPSRWRGTLTHYEGGSWDRPGAPIGRIN